MAWKGPLPVLTEKDWTVLYALAEDTLTPHALRKLTGWLKPEADEWMNREPISEFVQYNDQDRWYWLTGTGGDVVAARKALLDPNTLAERLTAIQTSLQAVLDSGLNRRAIVTLLHDSTKVSRGNIESVLDGLENIRKHYCK